jgi:CRISPR-associated endonuclease/helicase Cas3
LAFQVLTGHSPMRWQCRLFERMLGGNLPDAVDLPTGLGKTSVMAIWLLARALAGAETALPRRLVYVVDRRVVVDQATAEAEKLRDALDGDPKRFAELEAALRAQAPKIAAELKKRLGIDDGDSLLISTLRGGRADDRAWTYDPAAPAIIVCTVDLAGSRLLFSGYRMSRWSRSAQAGLMGVDSLIVLDEAHIAPAMLKAVDRVLVLRTDAAHSAIPPLRFLPLSATPPETGVKDVFRLEPTDFEDELVARRTGRVKPTKWVIFEVLPDKRNKETLPNESSAKEESKKVSLSDALAQKAAALDGAARAVLVFCNSRAAANDTADALRKKLAQSRDLKETELREDVALITGARRGKERDELVEKETYRAFTYRDGKRDLPADGRTRYLVCTAAGEVGADLDADAAVMDLVPLERMIQRLGRVNRRGECEEPAPVVIHYDPAALKVSAPDKEEKKAEAGRLAATKAALEALPPLNGGLDASPVNLAALDRDARRAASTPPPDIPAIEREHVEAWALTSLGEHPGRPEVDPFLRGIVDEEPQTTVAWRADVAQLAQLPARAIEQTLTAARLMPAELLEAPTREVIQFLERRVKVLRKDWERTQNAGEKACASVSLLALKYGKFIGRGEVTLAGLEIVYATGEKARLSREAEDESAGAAFGGETEEEQSPGAAKRDLDNFRRMIEDATILLEPTFGGLDQDGALDANAAGRDDLHVQPKGDDVQQGLVIRLVTPANEDSEARVRLLTAPAAIADAAAALQQHEIAPAVLRRLGLRRAWFAELPPEGGNPDESGPILEYWKHWDIDGETGAASALQSLAKHQAEAKDEMEKLTQRLSLHPELADTLIRSIAIHDTGKARAIWQDGVGAPRHGRPYAKSDRRGPGVRGYRHEFGSLRDALYKKEVATTLGGLSEEHRELALHLIASHHGRARPSIPAEDEEEIFPAVLDEDALQAAIRYVRLQRRWGPWGLAWLEALFRSVDATVSRRLEIEGETDISASREAAE